MFWIKKETDVSLNTLRNTHPQAQPLLKKSVLTHMVSKNSSRTTTTCCFLFSPFVSFSLLWNITAAEPQLVKYYNSILLLFLLPLILSTNHMLKSYARFLFQHYPPRHYSQHYNHHHHHYYYFQLNSLTHTFDCQTSTIWVYKQRKIRTHYYKCIHSLSLISKRFYFSPTRRLKKNGVECCKFRRGINAELGYIESMPKVLLYFSH